MVDLCLLVLFSVVVVVFCFVFSKLFSVKCKASLDIRHSSLMGCPVETKSTTIAINPFVKVLVYIGT